MVSQPSHITARAFKTDKEHSYIEMVQMQEEQRQPANTAPQSWNDLRHHNWWITDKKQAQRHDDSTRSDGIQSLCLKASAQQAELKALIEACKLAKGQTANISSRYAFGVTHDSCGKTSDFWLH